MRIARAIVPATALVVLAGCAAKDAAIETTTTTEAKVETPTKTAVEGPKEALLRQIGEKFDDPVFANAFWGVKIESLDTGEVWYERNAGKLFMPASNEKIPTTAAALTTLGPDFKFTTKLCTDGEVRDGVLNGNLIVFGDGDPTMYTRFQKDSRDAFFEWADALKAKGITKIAGDVIGDDDAFDDQQYGRGWPLDGLDAWYSAEVGALQFNENYIDLKITPPKTVDGKLTVEPNVPTRYVNIVDRTTTTTDGRTSINVSRAYGTNDIVLTGTAKVGDASFEESPAIWNATAFYATVLEETLESKGIVVEGRAVDCDDLPEWSHKPEEFTLLATRQSPPLKDIAAGLMKRSQNMYAETMPRVLGYRAEGVGSFSNGRREVMKALAPFGIDGDSFVYADGSGLSRYNLISPNHLVAILKGMRRHALWQVWYDSMPIAGVDGTLRSRMKGTPAEGNVHAKTGTISNVRGLSGYVKTKAGEEVVFSFLVNSHNVSDRENERITDGVLALIAAYDWAPENKTPVAAGN